MILSLRMNDCTVIANSNFIFYANMSSLFVMSITSSSLIIMIRAWIYDEIFLHIYFFQGSILILSHVVIKELLYTRKKKWHRILNYLRNNSITWIMWVHVWIGKVQNIIVRVLLTQYKILPFILWLNMLMLLLVFVIICLKLSINCYHWWGINIMSNVMWILRFKVEFRVFNYLLLYSTSTLGFS